MSDQFIGSGLAFPLRTEATGGLALVSGDREIQEAIRLVLSTAPGERPMRPEFGCRINEFVFSAADGATAGFIASEVRSALEQWEPRIVVQDVRIDFSRAYDGELYIDIWYAHRGSNDPRNLVFPFYVIPPHDPEEGV